MLKASIDETMVEQALKAARAITPNFKTAVAINLFRSLHERFPGSETALAAYLEELLIAEHWGAFEDENLRTACKNSYECTLLLIEADLARMDLIAAQESLTKIAQNSITNIDFNIKLLMFYRLSRRYTDALVVLKKIKALDPTSERSAIQLERIIEGQAQQRYTNVQEMSGETDYEIFIINLDSAQHRYARLKTMLEKKSSTRISAVLGKDLPDSAISILSKCRTKQTKGSVGCFLSHVSAWEAITSSSAPFGLVLEDDAILYMPLPQKVTDFLNNEKSDICFVNERIARLCRNYPKKLLNTLPVESAFSNINSDSFFPAADGYILSKYGAAKLLNFVERDGISGDVDWRLLTYCLSGKIMQASSIEYHSTLLMQQFQVIDPIHQLNGRFMSIPLVGQLSTGTQRFERNNLEQNEAIKLISHYRENLKRKTIF